jgi:iron complex transport system ATP-binding protein
MSAPIVAVHGLDWSYGERQLFERLALDILDATFTTIVGPNGSGKTTLLKHLLRILPVQAGTVDVLGRDVVDYPRRELAKRISHVPQKGSADYEFTVSEFVAMGRYPHIPRFSVMSADDHLQVDHALSLTGLEDLKSRTAGELSGGEFQRMVIARALAQQGRIIALDEPVTHLDVRNQRDILLLLRSLVDTKQVAVICVLHDLNAAMAFSDRVVMMERGHIAAEGTPHEVLTVERIRQVYQVEVESFKNEATGTIALVPTWK